MSEQTLSFDGDDLLSVMISLVLQSLCYGIYAALMPFSIHILVKKGLNSRIKIYLLFAISFQFIVSTAYWTVRVAELFIKVKGYFVDQPPKNVRNLAFISLWNSVGLVNYVFADGVVVWRACALCRQDYGKILIAPIFFLALSLLSVCATIGVRVIINLNLNETTLGIDICQMSAGVWSWITNLTATAIISHKAWCHRKIIREGLRNTLDKRSNAERVLALLIESGLLYCVSGLTIITTSAIRLPIGTLGDVYSAVSYHIAGVYPTIVIVIVALEKTMKETTFDSVQIGDATACTASMHCAHSVALNDEISSQLENISAKSTLITCSSVILH